MLRNYLKVAIRNLIRNKTYVLINVTGLSIALAVSVVAYLNFRHKVDANTEHANYENIFRVNGLREINGDRQNVGIVPLPLAGQARDNISGIEEIARYTKKNEIIKVGDVVFREDIAYVDPDFFKIFSFSTSNGASPNIEDPSKILLSKNLAERLFDNESPVGKDIRIVSNGNEYLFNVIGVLNAIPTNSTFRFDAVISIENYFNHYPSVSRTNWGESVDGVFTYINDTNDRNSIEKQLDAFIPLQRDANEHLAFESFILIELMSGPKTRCSLSIVIFGVEWTGCNMGFKLIGYSHTSFILFHFTNTSISFSNRRLKEIGVRKVFGGSRLQLITQFLIENLILIVAAMVMGLVMAEMLIPAFNNLFWFLHIELDLLNNYRLIVFLLLLLVFVAAFLPFIRHYMLVRLNQSTFSEGRPNLDRAISF